ncbi:hypothetical protein [Pedobacter xixiisoli]|uniref:DUF4251 domain-containing protein n=1 Tax=Pedobacter xixiisoli TaxID=1476464 RepID=A0A286A785_9SPHI|nr:hypothetical protein [Pedobacter xixiisoli]SOD17749.1 hypothetical protein SAMN06297358_2668 [Pedobacter xixiisoli]
MKKSICTLSLYLMCISCTSNNSSLDLKETTIAKDTLQHEEILKDMDYPRSKNVKAVQLNYYNADQQKVAGLQKNDTFILGITYNGKKFQQLAKSNKIYLEPETKNFKILKSLPDNRYKIFVEPSADTLIFDIQISSDKFVFNSYYLDNNRQIQYKIVDKIGLCKKIEVVD